MKKILVPTDFSVCANHASDAAIRIAKVNGGSVYFLHYMSIPINWVHLEDGDELYPDITQKVKEVRNQLEEWMEMARKGWILITTLATMKVPPT